MLVFPLAQTLFGGVAIVGASLAAWWYAMQRHQARKEAIDPATGGSLPTWEYRIYQARTPADNAGNPAALRQIDAEGSSQPPPPSSGSRSSALDRADKAVPDAPQTKSGSSPDPKVGPGPGPAPTPQRTREDNGRVYTKAAKYVDNYEAKKPK